MILNVPFNRTFVARVLKHRQPKIGLPVLQRQGYGSVSKTPWQKKIKNKHHVTAKDNYK